MNVRPRRRRRRRVDPQRALQIGFVLLLVVCAAQVVWWIYDEIVYTGRIRDAILEHHRADLRAARMLIECGVDREEVLGTFDELAVGDGGELIVDPDVVEAFSEERFGRINRYAWEGGFFLLVLAAGVTVLTRAMRQDTALRRRQQNFVAAVSHELKSPVASMRLAAETLLYRDPPADGRRRIVGRLVQDIDRLETMVANILDTARIEEGELVLAPQRLSLVEVSTSVVEELRPRAEESGIALSSEGDPEVEIEIDEVALRSVLRNLIDNAIKASESQTGGRISVDVAREDGKARLDVSDDGIGFPPEQAEVLFEKFYRPGDEMQRPSRGSGLGLYLVRRFVELHRGEIHASSPGPGRGATFTIRWPLAGENR